MYWPTINKAEWNPIYTSDPYAGDVYSLCHFNGINGSTTITDNGLGTTTWLCGGAAAISTAQSKFNGSSLKVPTSNGDTVTGSTALGNKMADVPFTMDLWYFPITTPPTATSGLVNFGPGPKLGLFADNAGKIELWVNGVLSYTSVSTFTVGVWNYLAWQRSAGNDHTLYINGVLQSGAVFTTQTVSGVNCIVGNQNNGAAPANFYFAELRFTVGVNRYSGSFSPPLTPFPNP